MGGSGRKGRREGRSEKGVEESTSMKEWERLRREEGADEEGHRGEKYFDL